MCVCLEWAEKEERITKRAGGEKENTQSLLPIPQMQRKKKKEKEKSLTTTQFLPLGYSSLSPGTL